MPKRLTEDEFVKRARNKHDNFYDYSKVEYKGARTNVIITCPIHNHGYFFQRPDGHLRGQGCPRCASEKNGENKRSNTEEFIERSNLIHHNFYDYSKVEYVNAITNVCIICPIRGHGDFFQRPDSHLCGRGCPMCANENNKSNTEEFIERSKEKHGNNRYNYSKVEYVNAITNVCITCPIHNHGDFFQGPSEHLRGKGCPRCVNRTSKPAQSWLESLGINNLIYDDGINSEYSILGTRYSADGYDPDTNTIYEFHGDYWHGNPDVFNPEEYNKSTKCSYGELHRRTLEKKNALINLGYNYIEMWENDWKKQLN